MSAAVGKKLREARQAQDLTLDQAAQATHIRLRFLQAMEAGNFDALPSKVQVKGFLRSYADYLGLDGEQLLVSLGEAAPTVKIPPADSPAPPESQADSPPDVLLTSFEQVGQRLRSQRELLGLSIPEVERHTHLRIRYLKALENGNLGGLPSPVQGRGMLKNYAEFLSLDPDPLLLTFAEGLQSQLVEKQPQAVAVPEPTQTRRERPKRQLINRDMVIGGILIIALLAFGIWGILRINETRAGQEIPPTPPSIADVLLPSPSATLVPTLTATLIAPQEGLPAGDTTEGDGNNPTAAPLAATQVIRIPENADGPVRVQIVIRQRAWMRITVDGDIVFEGRVIPGAAYAFAGDEIVEILTGSGSALQVFYNDIDLGAIGRYGEVVNYVITIDGVQTPTPTITFTPTETETLEATSTLTPTP